jgi:predicted nucleic acid-binding protein
MRVYVETNFLVEISLAQEELSVCEEILSLCQNSSVNLIVPAFSIPEAYHALVGRHRERVQFSNELNRQLVHLRRSAEFNAGSEFDIVQRYLTTSAQNEQARYQTLVERLRPIARLIPLTNEVLELARTWQSKSGLELPDSIVLASVVSDLSDDTREHATFIARDSDLTDDPEIKAVLQSLNCELKARFSAGLGYLNAKTQKA